MSRFLEDRDKADRTRDPRTASRRSSIAVDVRRIDLHPGLLHRYRFSPARACTAGRSLAVPVVLAVYAVVFDAVPRILAGSSGEPLLGLFLPAYRRSCWPSPPPSSSSPAGSSRREESEEAAEEDREAERRGDRDLPRRGPGGRHHREGRGRAAAQRRRVRRHRRPRDHDPPGGHGLHPPRRHLAEAPQPHHRREVLAHPGLQGPGRQHRGHRHGQGPPRVLRRARAQRRSPSRPSSGRSSSSPNP